MNSLPKISMITPSYQQAQFIEQTLQSVIQQGYPNLEYMVVDGGSKDGSVDIIRKYEEHLAWWVSERDSGQSEACNKGWKRATGDIIGWLNSDDLILPGTLDRVAKAFQETPEVGFIFGDVLSIDADGNVFNVMKFAPWGLDELMAFNIICQPGVFMRRDVLEKAGYLDAGMHFLQDHHLWLKLAQLAPMRYIPETMAAARYHAAAKNVGAGERYGKDAYRIVEWMKTQPVLAEKMKKLNRKIMAGAHRISARYLLDGGAPGAALRDYAKSFWAYPPTALAEWHRMVYSVLALLGMEKLKHTFYNRRLNSRRLNEPAIYRNVADLFRDDPVLESKGILK